MNTARIRSWHAGIAATGVLLCMATAAGAQDDGPARGKVPTSGVPAWFSLPLPAKPGATPAVVVGTRGPRAVTLPPGEAESPEFDGATILEDLKAVVAIATESRKSPEIGSGQLWGRVSGFPSGAATARWAAERFRKAGLTDIKVQRSRSQRRPRSGCRCRGKSACWAIRRSVPAAATSCSNRQCRCRHRQSPARP